MPAAAAGAAACKGRLAGVRLAHRRAAAAAAGDVQLAARRSPQPQRRRAPRGAAARIETSIALLRGQLAACSRFQSRLMSTCSRSRSTSTPRIATPRGGALVVNAAVNGDRRGRWRKRWESMVAREQRFEARVGGARRAHDELRALDRRRAAGGDDAEARAGAAARLATELELRNAQSAAPDRQRRSRQRPPDAFAPALDAYKYVGFEDQFRGSQETIRARLESYLPYFDGASDVLDVGCGRGEFLDLLAARGISARGLDLNHEMVEVCRARGLDVAESGRRSAISRRCPTRRSAACSRRRSSSTSSPAYLLRFLELAFHKLRPGAPIVLETLNPACWVGVLRQLHPRHHARAGRCIPRRCGISCSRAASRRRAHRIPLAGAGRTTSCRPSPPTAASPLADAISSRCSTRTSRS